MKEDSPIFDKKAVPFVLPIVFILGIFIGVAGIQIFNSIRTFSQRGEVYSASVENSNYVNEVFSLIQDRYLGSIPSGRELDYAKIKGIISSLDTKYNNFLTPQESQAYSSSLNPNFEGIGISLKFDGSNTQVESVFRNYPAEGAGILVGDVILKVDEIDMLGKLPSEVASKIRGVAGSEVKVEVFRSGASEALTFNIIRKQIDIDNVSFKKLDNGIYKIDIFQFIDETPEALNESWDRLVAEIVSNNDAKGIILDLRNNPGGYVFSARYIMEEFFKNGTILFKEEQKNSSQKVYTDQRVGRFEDLPLTLLVNEGSASASEIFAGAVQDNNRGEVIGQKTVGKGVEQQQIKLNDGSMLILVFQRWLTPSGRNVTNDDPITPDFIIEYTQEDFRNLKDPQLDKAKELLSK